MLRVAHIVPVWLPQTQTWIDTLVGCIPQERVECHVICERTENLDQFPVRHLHDLSHRPLSERLVAAVRRLSGEKLPSLDAALSGLGPQVVHSHFGDAAWTHLGAVRRARARHIASFYGYDVAMLPKQAQWPERLSQLFQAVDRVVCEGPYMGESLVKLGCPREKLRVHHLGVRLKKLPFVPRRWQPGEPLRVLIAATFTEKKGIPYGIEALALLRREIDLSVTIIGDARSTPEDRKEKEHILATLRSTGLDGAVRMLGYQSHEAMIREAYLHHLFLAPSVVAASGDTEGGAPVSIIEMAASGMVVVSSRHCDIPEVIIDAETGWLADERDVGGIAVCLRRAVQSREKWDSMLEKGRRRVEDGFDAERQGSRLAAIYEEFLA